MALRKIRYVAQSTFQDDSRSTSQGWSRVCRNWTKFGRCRTNAGRIWTDDVGPIPNKTATPIGITEGVALLSEDVGYKCAAAQPVDCSRSHGLMQKPLKRDAKHLDLGPAGRSAKAALYTHRHMLSELALTLERHAPWVRSWGHGVDDACGCERNIRHCGSLASWHFPMRCWRVARLGRGEEGK